MLPNGLDIAVFVIIGVFVFLGWKSGIVKMGIRLASFGLALICAWMFHPFLADFLRTTSLYNTIFSSLGGQGTAGAEAGSLQEMATTAGNTAAEYGTNLLLNGISFLVILIAAKILIYFLGKLLHFVASLPVLGFINRLGGMLVGLLEGLLIVWIVMAIMVVIPSLREDKKMGYAVEQSIVARSLYHNNLVLKAFMPEEKISDGD